MLPSFARTPNCVPIALAVLLSTCTASNPQPGTSPVQAHMLAHFDKAGKMHDALVEGDLQAARNAAHWIASHPEDHKFSDKSIHFQDESRAFANAVEQSGELDEASHAAARMGQACGGCHQENQVEPRFLIGTVPPSGSGPQAEMARHVWASERMWEGLIGPGDRAWTSGVEALKAGWLDSGEVVSDPEDRTRIHELTRHVYDLADAAAETKDPGQRAEIYGEFLTTCAECHKLTEATIR